MDKALYIGMTGAVQTMRQQQANNNNLANASSTGFRAELVDSAPIQVDGFGFDSRYNAQSLDSGWDPRMGPIQQTGRELDITLRQDSWLTVQTADGGTAYTRAGNLQINSTGQLLDGQGHPVMSDNGPISVPPYSSITLGADGTLTVIPLGSAPNTSAIVNRLLVVDATPDQLKRGQDGLMYSDPGVTLNPAVGNSVTTGALEGSNVNVVDSMVNMIQLLRQFELQTKVLHAADDNASQASTLLKME